jgi:DNA mismatch repair protein MSH2
LNIQSATENSLIVIDELGRGTSTYDGFGLAWSISSFIVEKLKAHCLFATHFHELSTLENNYKSVVNFHMESKQIDNKLIMLYEVKKGVCHQSLGIQVAEMAKFPREVLELAKRKLDELEDYSENDVKKKTKIDNEREIGSFLKFFCKDDLSNPERILEILKTFE